MPAWTGTTFLAAYKIMEPVAGMGKTATMLWVVPVSFLYVFLAGYKGVVVSNLVQMVIFTVGTGPRHLNGGALRRAVRTGGATPERIRAGGRGESASSRRYGTTCSRSPRPSRGWWGRRSATGATPPRSAAAVEGQRILSTRSPREAVTMYIVTAFTMFTFVMLVSLPCVAAPLLWPHLRRPGGRPRAGVRPAHEGDAAARHDGDGGRRAVGRGDVDRQ